MTVDTTRPKFREHFEWLLAAVQRDADNCPECKGHGYVWRQYGPNNVDKDVCESCLDLRALLFKAAQS